ncbi:MAG: PaaI family thioesterase [Burkholderiales bacterium]|nr:PaaI family thioesterase [Phycisphaerae bacterium]
MQLTSFVDLDTDEVEMPFTPTAAHMGFQNVIHGGILATVLDEAMVWAAIWKHKQFCLAGEITVRFRKPATVGQAMRVSARVVSGRGRILITTGQLVDGSTIIAEATGKYVQVPGAQHAAFLASLIPETKSRESIRMLTSSAQT